MPLRTDIYYRDMAGETVQKAGITEPPVDVWAVARNLGLPVRATPLPEFFYGALIAEDGMPVAVLNSAKDQLRQRNALAHLLGHVLVVLDDPTLGYPRGTGDHRVADVVAAEIVAPAYLVKDQAMKWFNDYRYLARLFAVPESEMLDRMKAAGLIQSRGITWDY